MELDHIKEIWRRQSQPERQSLSNEEVMTMITHPSRSPVAIMKRNLKKELIFIVVSFSIASLVFSFQGKMIAYSGAYLFLMGVFFYYYYFKNRLLNSMQCVTCEVKSNLGLLVNNLEKYVRYNLVISTFILPLFLAFVVFIMYLNFKSVVPRSVLHFSPAHPAWLTILVWLVISTVMTIPLFYLNRKYLYWLYGKHIARIRKILTEMDEDQG